MSSGVRPMIEDKPINPAQFTSRVPIDQTKMSQDLDRVTTEIKEARERSSRLNAVQILNKGVTCIGDRAATRDQDQERSMAKCVKIFNAYSGTNLSEKDGWMFMVCLKMAREAQGGFNIDDYIDGAAYFALAGECKGGKL